MRDPWPAIVEGGRLMTEQDEIFGSAPNDPGGAFYIMSIVARRYPLKIIANRASKDSYYWEHVSVSLPDRTPSWEEMCYVKSLFWQDDECVIQFHPPSSSYVNYHPFTLHLWRPGNQRFPFPPSHLVGPKT